jgi:coatomer subunit beta'
VTPKQIYWSDSGELVAIACDSAFYILKYDKTVVASYFASNAEAGEEGIEEAFQILHEIPER